MTEDPVKLYVIVMAILLCVLSYVAYDSWQQASAYEAAINRAPREAEQMKALASEVKALVEQIAKSELRDGGEKVLIERVEKTMKFAREDGPGPEDRLARMEERLDRMERMLHHALERLEEREREYERERHRGHDEDRGR